MLSRANRAGHHNPSKTRQSECGSLSFSLDESRAVSEALYRLFTKKTITRHAIAMAVKERGASYSPDRLSQLEQEFERDRPFFADWVEELRKVGAAPEQQGPLAVIAMWVESDFE